MRGDGAGDEPAELGQLLVDHLPFVGFQHGPLRADLVAVRTRPDQRRPALGGCLVLERGQAGADLTLGQRARADEPAPRSAKVRGTRRPSRLQAPPAASEANEASSSGATAKAVKAEERQAVTAPAPPARSAAPPAPESPGARAPPVPTEPVVTLVAPAAPESGPTPRPCPTAPASRRPTAQAATAAVAPPTTAATAASSSTSATDTASSRSASGEPAGCRAGHVRSTRTQRGYGCQRSAPACCDRESHPGKMSAPIVIHRPSPRAAEGSPSAGRSPGSPTTTTTSWSSCAGPGCRTRSRCWTGRRGWSGEAGVRTSTWPLFAALGVSGVTAQQPAAPGAPGPVGPGAPVPLHPPAAAPAGAAGVRRRSGRSSRWCGPARRSRAPSRPRPAGRRSRPRA